VLEALPSRLVELGDGVETLSSGPHGKSLGQLKALLSEGIQIFLMGSSLVLTGGHYKNPSLLSPSLSLVSCFGM
jgi:hypothetical protein